MKKLITIALLLICNFSFGRSWYFANAGNDATGNGTITTPYATIAKLNTLVFAASDLILFNRGNTFYGNITVPRANLSFDAYGTGAKPIISGLSTITGWVSLGGNIWEAPTTNVKATVNLVLRNGIAQQVGRYPNVGTTNGGYLTLTAATSTSLTGPELSSVTNWTGAEVVVRSVHWDIQRRTITNHTGGVMTFASLGRTPAVGFGYFVQRDPRTLDADGEWFYNSSTNKIRVYSTIDPNGWTYKISTVDTLFSSLYGSLSINNLTFEGANKKCVWTNGGSYIKITNCDVTSSGNEGITTWFSDNVTLINDTVKNVLGSGIRVYNQSTGVKNLSVTNCFVNDNALKAGMEANDGVNGSMGLLVAGGDNVTCNYNKIIGSGYNNIQVQGNNLTTNYNIIDSGCLVRDDGAGIYIVETGTNYLIPTRFNRKIDSNFVSNIIGNNNGTPGLFETSTEGIYLDLGTRTMELNGNVIWNIGGNGIHGNNNKDITIINNTIFNTTYHYSSQRFDSAALVRGMTIKKNIFYPYRFRYRNLGLNYPTLLTKQADLAAFGTIDSNYYSLRAGTDTSIGMVTTYVGGSNYTETYSPFSYLTGTVGIETHSTNVANTGTLYTNPTGTFIVVNFSGLNKKDVYNTNYSNFAVIQAWSSKVLIPNGTSNIPPVANAGVDQIITLPTSTITLAGSGTDADGTVTGYSWFKLSGNTGDIITSPLTASTTVSFTQSGVYQYVLTVTDNLGLTGKDTVQITVNPAPLVAPTVNAGIDQTLQLPTTANLLATVTGNISNVTWSFITVPSGSVAVFGTSATLATNITGLIAGVYSIKCTVLDFNGLTAKDTVQLTVNAAAVVTPPSCSAGTIGSYTLPISSTILTDVVTPGTNPVSSYLWTQTGGATTTITNSTTTVATISGITVSGTYQYLFKATDNAGNFCTSTFQITALDASCNCIISRRGKRVRN